MRKLASNTKAGNEDSQRKQRPRTWQLDAKKYVAENEDAGACDRCHVWHHKDCAGIDAEEFSTTKRKKVI
jgi:hypothetical protein